MLPDNALINIASDSYSTLGILSSRIHFIWSLATGGTQEDRPRYIKTRCFETFPFPVLSEQQAAEIGKLAERIDAHRKQQQALHSELTLTGMYNVLEK
ncbi:type IIL restriction-modification enzyme MmeI [Halomonas hibernica]|uniref:type IIL restriction-modification enzyme MmeI n=1 Tax=Halomonas hibernica TaxID=2591147 RepID=UPI0038739C8B